MPAIAGPFISLVRKAVGSVGSSFSKSRSKFTDATSSTGAKRVPSSTASTDVELAQSGGISKSVESSMTMYNIPNDARSDDDVELVSREFGGPDNAKVTGRNPRITSHEYASQWR